MTASPIRRLDKKGAVAGQGRVPTSPPPPAFTRPVPRPRVNTRSLLTDTLEARLSRIEDKLDWIIDQQPEGAS